MKRCLFAALLTGCLAAPSKVTPLPVVEGELTTAPNVPKPITRRAPALVKVAMTAQEVEGVLAPGVRENTRYKYWTFNGTVPGPMLRVRQGDTLELTLSNAADSKMPHNIDFHAATGPGGGAPITTVLPGKTSVARLKMLNPGLYVYHCAVPPVPFHVANGMYGMILVEPKEGLPVVDKEFYLMQSEFYTREKFGYEGLATFDAQAGMDEKPTYIVLNGAVGSTMNDKALKAKAGDTVRLFVGDGGPNLTSSFHVIGEIFDRCYPEGSTGSPELNVQTTSIPPGGAAMCELKMEMPGNYLLVDHAIFRMAKGCAGMLTVEGQADPAIYQGMSQ